MIQTLGVPDWPNLRIADPKWSTPPCFRDLDLEGEPIAWIPPDLRGHSRNCLLSNVLLMSNYLLGMVTAHYGNRVTNRNQFRNPRNLINDGGEERQQRLCAEHDKWMNDPLLHESPSFFESDDIAPFCRVTSLRDHFVPLSDVKKSWTNHRRGPAKNSGSLRYDNKPQFQWFKFRNSLLETNFFACQYW